MIISQKIGFALKNPMVLTRCLKMKECIGNCFRMNKRDSKMKECIRNGFKNEGMYKRLFQNEGIYWKLFKNEGMY